MALTCSKTLYLQLSKYGKRNLFCALENNYQNYLSAAQFSDHSNPSHSKLSKAMRAYLERAEKYDKFMKEQLQEYNLGRKFLTNMMGKGPEVMSEEDVDKAIQYLFPSALFVPKSRPMMKPPEFVYEKQKKPCFDYTGRPFHYLFYTTKQNYSECLHEAASHLEQINQGLRKKEAHRPLILVGGRWLSKVELEKKFSEKLYDIEYEKFIELFTRLSQHPFASDAKNFINNYWIVEEGLLQMRVPEFSTDESNRKIINIEKLKKKTSKGKVTVTFPGTGLFEINGLGLDYFSNMLRRHQKAYEFQDEQLKKQQVDGKMMRMSRLVTHC